MKKLIRRKAYSRLTALFFMWQIIFTSLTPTVVHAVGDMSNDIQLSVLKNGQNLLEYDVQSGDSFVYNIKYTFASTTSDFTGAYITLQIPDNAQYISATGSAHTSGVTYDATSRQVKFTFNNPLSACTGTLQVNLKFPNGVTPDGTVINSIASIYSDNAQPKDSNSVKVTAHADSEWNISKEKTSPMTDPLPGSEVTYDVKFVHDNLAGSGYLNLQNAKMVDTLPAQAQFVSATGNGVYDANTNTVTWDLGTLDPGTADQGYLTKQVTVKYPQDISTTVTNKVTGTGTMVGDQAVNVSSEVTHGFQTTEIPHVSSFIKTAPSELAIGQNLTYSISKFGNDSVNGNVELDNIIFEDNFPQKFKFSKLKTGTYGPNPSATYTVKYKTNLNGAWTAWPNRTFTRGTNTQIAVEELSLAQNEYVTGIRMEFGKAERNFKLNDWLLIDGSIMSPDIAGNQVAPGKIVTNTARATGIYKGVEADFKEASCDTKVVDSDPMITPHIEVVNPKSSYVPGDEVEYELKIKNGFTATGDLLNPIVLDLLPDGLEYVDGSWALTQSDSIQPIFEKIDNYNNTGKTLLKWRWEDASALSLPIDGERRIRFKAKIKPYTPTGTITNKYQVTTNTGNNVGYSYEDDTLDLDGDGSTTDKLFRDQCNITVNEATALQATKWVKGVLDSDWKRYDQNDPIGSRAKTTPGGTIDYKLDITNVGNTTVNNIKVIDILPFINDQTVYSGQPRGSQWTPALAGPIIAPPGIDVYYSTVSNPDRSELGINLPGTQPANWSLTPPDDITTVKSIKIEVPSEWQDPSTGSNTWMNPGKKLEIQWKMVAPIGSPIDSVAYDSFAFTAQNMNSGEQVLASEPIKVGVEIKENSKAEIGDFVWIDNNKNGIQDGEEIGLNGIKVELYDEGDNLIASTTTADSFDGKPGYYLFTNLNGGKYYVKFILPDGCSFTQKNAGDSEHDSDVDITTGKTPIIDLPSGKQDRSWDAGLTLDKPSSIGDKVWQDTNGDGIQDNGENGLAGITVKLFKSNGTLVETKTTDEKGNYKFTGLYRGDYYLEFETPGGYTVSPKNAGSDAAKDSDIDTVSGKTDIVTLGIGEENLTIDAGFIPKPATVGDTVWNDTNGNGIQDVGEVGIPNVKVKLVDDSGNVVTTTTDSNGNYKFENVVPGNYTVLIDESTLLAGMKETYELDNTLDNSVSISLTPEQVKYDVDFGFRSPAVVGDTVWNDANGNGIQDAGEVGIPNVKVKLTDANGKVLAEITTDSKGNYKFENLIPGNYTVTIDDTTLPAGMKETYELDNTLDKSVIVTLTEGQIKYDVDFGFRLPAAVGDTVWNDANGNGIQDAGEAGIPNVKVKLTDSNGKVLAEITTDSKGNYKFENLIPGNYTVTIDDTTLPAGMKETYELDNTLDKSVSVTLTEGQIKDDVDFGFVAPAVVGDTVWNDANGNGIQDAGEAGIPNVKVKLTDANGKVLAEITTDSKGNYKFENLIPGSYTVTIDDTTLPAGMKETYELDNTLDKSVNVSLVQGQIKDDVDFGFVAPAVVGDTVWNDANGNGIQDAGEAGIPNVKVKLTDSSGKVLAEITTDSKGNYKFENLVPGNYTISVDEITLPVGMKETYELDNTLDKSVSVTLTEGQIKDDVDFGFVAPAVVGDTVWNDANGNEIQDAGEAGIPNVKVKLTDANGNVVTVTTDSNGKYKFENLIPGNYTISIDETTLPAGMKETHELDNTLDKSVNVSLVQGQIKDDVDFGFVAPAVVGDTVWNDANGNGIQDAGEAGIPNVKVKLTDANGNVVTVTTDSNGKYKFENLIPGNYTISIDETTLPAGMKETYELDSTLDKSVIVTLTEGQIKDDVDFGFRSPAVVGDTVWNDANGDGIQDAREAGIPNVKVKLTDANGKVLAEITTDSNGNYKFENLIPGNYTISIDETTLPAGMKETYELDSTLDKSVIVTLTEGQIKDDVDFGFRSPAVVGDTVWNDANGNGIQDAGEVGIPNIKVKLTDANGKVLAEITTDSNGNYKFENLIPGNYTISIDEITLPAGMKETYELDNTLDKSVIVALTEGQIKDDVDFGFVAPAVVGDTVWNDTNGNGIQDSGEAGIPNVKVKLTDANGNVVTVTTDSNGKYKFENLIPGNYTISIDETTLPAGMKETYELDNTLDKSVDVSLVPGQIKDDVDFGFVAPAVVGDTIWNDANGNGVQDPDEAGIPNVKVKLTDGNGNVVTVITDSNGKYNFENLMPGNYTVSIDETTLPAGMKETYELDNTLDKSVSVSLAEGQTKDDVDFGFRSPAVVVSTPDSPAVADTVVTNKISKLPKTGQPIDTSVLIIIGSILIGAGFVLRRNKKIN